MARQGGLDRGITKRKGREGWWTRLSLNGKERWFHCDAKSKRRRSMAARRRKGDDKPRADKWIQTFGDQDAATITVR
jgi:hypothetical protein